jgi:predicted aconitase
MLEAARRALSTGSIEVGATIDAVAVGSPHFSFEEFRTLLGWLNGRRVVIPFYACTGRHVTAALDAAGLRAQIDHAGITVVTDTCIVVTPILKSGGGLLMTNSGKFAHYAPSMTGWDVLYGGLGDCVESAVTGRFTRDETLWR